MEESVRIPEEALKKAQNEIQSIMDNIETVIVGKHASVELVVLALLARGHVLIEDVPGVGKTSLVSAVAKSVDCGFKRIQFTPDLMPSDVTGFSVYNQGTGEFEFRPGAVMSNIVLADEINRASAKTQAALLEAMEEKQVTVDSHTYNLEDPFMVLATQNPLESFGTYPLPDAQIDRFLIKLSMGYPSVEEERGSSTMVRQARRRSARWYQSRMSSRSAIWQSGFVWTKALSGTLLRLSQRHALIKISVSAYPRAAVSRCTARLRCLP